jgi:HAD superfamily hydrolase (TIGR01549 family)
VAKGVIFDLWNTLVSAHGPKFVARLARILGLPVQEVEDYLRATGSLNSITKPEDAAADLWKFRTGSVIPDDKLREIEVERRGFIEASDYIDGARELLTDLRGNDIKIGVVSNATAVSLEVVAKLDLQGLVDFLSLSCVSGYLKPDPRVFRSVSREWGLSPAELLVVGDRVQTDALGARLCEIPVVLIVGDVSEPRRGAPSNLLGVVGSIADVRAFI